MKYEALLKVKAILDADIKRLEKIMEEIEVLGKSLEKDRRNILSYIRSSKNINPDILNVIESIIIKNNLKIEFNKELFASKLGSYYMLDSEEAKKQVEELLYPIVEELNYKKSISEKNKPVWEGDLNFKKCLSDAINSLVNLENQEFLKPVGTQVFESILNYILKIPSGLMTDDERLMAIYALNIANLEALQSNEKEDYKSNSDIIEKPLAKYRFEKENESEIEDINDLISLYNSISSSLTEIDKNQMTSLLTAFNLDTINQETIINIEEYIKNIGASFSADYFIKYVLLKNISDWYAYYDNSYIEDEWLSVFEEIRVAISRYQDYLEMSMSKNSGDAKVKNSLIFLQKSGGTFVGLDWMHKDSHDYEPRDFSDFDKGLDMIRDNSPVLLVENTKKVKRTGIPGISENKFRRLKVNTFRIIFIDLMHFIKEEYKEYFEGMPTCYLVITFGKKLSETDIYSSMETIGMTNLLREYQIYINDYLASVLDQGINKEEKKLKVRELLNAMIKENNELFNTTLGNDPDYAKLIEKNNAGGLKNA